MLKNDPRDKIIVIASELIDDKIIIKLFFFCFCVCVCVCICICVCICKYSY